MLRNFSWVFVPICVDVDLQQQPSGAGAVPLSYMASGCDSADTSDGTA